MPPLHELKYQDDVDGDLDFEKIIYRLLQMFIQQLIHRLKPLAFCFGVIT